ncbi:unnamed protein product [Owenia fusiformis]|uniref:Alkaline ceramidase n=1 Tax=Owenia fusiformis TaxID=6347 RepID=A0A8J1XTE3_OWEFU|nr:unnamed protein product [Owenia fusiformis]
MMKELEWGSSKVDWCESNYHITSAIAEFYNTISNVLFFLIPPILIYLFRQYTRQVDWGVNVVWVLLIIVGAGSVYFHTTLSIVGQLIDEISILWVVMSALALWYPRRYLPELFQNRGHFKMTMLFFTVITSGLACAVPEVNAFVLMLFGIPGITLLILELKRCENTRVYNLGFRCCVLFILAVTCWINDRLFCEVWASVNFPYLHCGWHLLIFIASYTACVFFAYFDALTEVPEQMPVLKYWPNDKWDIWGIPYISLKRMGQKPLRKF